MALILQLKAKEEVVIGEIVRLSLRYRKDRNGVLNILLAIDAPKEVKIERQGRRKETKEKRQAKVNRSAYPPSTKI